MRIFDCAYPDHKTQIHRMPLHPAIPSVPNEPAETGAKASRPRGRRLLSAIPVFLTLALLALSTSAARGQAAYTAKRAGDLQAGLGFSYARSDYGQPPSLRGGTFYASFDFKPHFGVEVDFPPTERAIELYTRKPNRLQQGLQPRLRGGWSVCPPLRHLEPLCAPHVWPGCL